MIWMRLNFVVISFSFISIIHSLMRFKLKNQCESKKEVTLVIDGMYIDNIKTIVTNLKEACVNIILVRLKPYGVVNVNSLNSIDLSFDHWLSQNVLYDDYHLKEYLQLFAEKSSTRRTLIVFSWFLNDSHLKILYNLQMKKNVVILVSYPNILDIKQIPRHLKFVRLSNGNYNFKGRNYNLNGLVDVIKNPKYNRFEFEKSFKNRSCLENVKIVVVSYIHDYISCIKNYNQESLDINTQDLIDYENKFTQLNKTIILKESKRKIFICFYLPDTRYYEDDNRIIKGMETHLKNNKQTVITLHASKSDRYSAWFIIFLNNSHEYDLRTKEGMEFLMDLLVDAGC